jgi:hypothetical protein
MPTGVSLFVWLPEERAKSVEETLIPGLRSWGWQGGR